MLIMVQQETTNNIFSNPFSASSAHRLDFIHAFGYAVRAETKQQGGIVPLPPPAFDFFFFVFFLFYGSKWNLSTDSERSSAAKLKRSSG